MLDRLEPWGVRLFCTDDWAPYDAALPTGSGVQRRAQARPLALPSDEPNDFGHDGARHSAVVRDN